MEFQTTERSSKPAIESGAEILDLREQVKRLSEEIAMYELHVEYLERQHGIDHLTGVSNRKFFEQELEQSLRFVRGEIHEHRGGGEGSREVSLVFIDLDHFKQINDQHGHPIGDEVLKRVSTLLINSVRETDVVARVGGEEFVVLLRGADQSFAALAAEKFRTEMEKLSFDSIGKPDLKVTASLGVSSSNSSTDPKVLYHYADKAVYEAKHGGRNQVVVHGNGKSGENHKK